LDSEERREEHQIANEHFQEVDSGLQLQQALAWEEMVSFIRQLNGLLSEGLVVRLRSSESEMIDSSGKNFNRP